MTMHKRASNAISISASPATAVIQEPYYDLPSIIKVMEYLLQESAVDGFEIQNLAEWNKMNPPKDDVTGNRYTAWKKSPKYTVEEVAALLGGLPVLSVHANRDVGIYLCSGKDADIAKGKTLIRESLDLAERVGCNVCVFHLWDTWKTDFDIMFVQEVFCETVSCYPGVKASVENIPTHLEGVTPFDLVRGFELVTLDLRWAAIYDELAKFESVKSRIVNVHMRGELQKNKWVLNNAPFGFYEALDIIKGWRYKGLLTVEPEGGIRGCNLEDLVSAMSSVRGQ